jgi:ankyrin repeat protein
MSLFFYIATNNKNYINTYLSLNKSAIDIKDKIGRTNLYYAIAYSDLYMVKFIMSFNPDLKIVDDFGLTSIEYAFFYDNINSTKYLEILSPNLTNDDINNIQKVIEEKISIYGDNLIGTLHFRDEDD